MSTKKIKALAIAIATLGLFGFILTRKNIAVSFTMQSLATISAIGYCFIKTDEELNPLSEAWKELETERERINKQYVEDCQNFELDKERIRQENQEELQHQKEYYIEDQKKIIQLYESELELYSEQLGLKENLLRQAKLPQLATGISRTETYANRIINYLYSKGIEADYADSWEEYSYDLIRLIPKNGASLKQFKDLTEELQLELRLSHSPSFDITQGCIQIRIDTRLIDTDKNTKPAKLQLIDGEWLPEIAAKIIHGKMDGETQSGKSTFVQNLGNILSNFYKGAEFISIDPKYPLSLNWDSELADWQRKPKFAGIERALNGLTELSNTVKNRLQLVTLDVQEGKKPRKFNKIVYLVDEIDWVILEYGKDATDLLQVGLKVGAALDVIVIYFGQTPRCSKLKMTKDDFRNSTNISLGSNIPDAIETYVFDEGYKKELLELYWHESNKGNIYISLVAQKGRKPFLAQLPAPSEHKPQYSYIHHRKPVNDAVTEKVTVTENCKTLETWNLHPEFTENDELELWKKIAQALSTEGKKFVIEEILEQKGRNYSKGLLYFGYLKQKFETS